MRGTLVLRVAALPLAVLVSACASPRGAERPKAAPGTPSAAATSSPAPGANGSGAPRDGVTGTQPVSAAASASGVPTGTRATTPAAAGSAAVSASPTPRHKPQVSQAPASELPIKAVIAPKCVVRGTTATLTVQTLPKAKIAFVAVYHGKQSGAEPPWGKGYGGNAHGESDTQGDWTSTWTVSPTAPTGDAYVLVVVGHHGTQRQVEVPFSVRAREADGCGT